MYIQLLQNLDFPQKEQLMPLMEKKSEVFPLLIATKRRLWESIPFLLSIPEIMMSINEKDEYGLTALHWAMLRNKSEIVNLLEPDVEKRNAELAHWRNPVTSLSLLMLAIVQGRIAGVQYLLTIPQIKTSINEKDKHGLTALHWAALCGKSEIVNLLEPDVEKRNAELAKNWQDNGLGKSVSLLTLAIVRNWLAGVPYLLTIPQIKASLNKKDELGLTALHQAALYGKSEIINLLEPNVEKRNAELANWRGSLGESLLIVATRSGLIAGVQYLLTIPQIKASLNKKDKLGLTALFYATRSERMSAANSANIIKLMLASGADVNTIDKKTWDSIKSMEILEVLEAALKLIPIVRHTEYKSELWDALLEKGASIHQQSNGYPILHMAIKSVSHMPSDSVNSDLVSALLKMGANIQETNIDGYNAIKYAQRCLPHINNSQMPGTVERHIILMLFSHFIKQNLENNNFEIVILEIKEFFTWIKNNISDLESKSEIYLQFYQLIRNDHNLFEMLGFDFFLEILKLVPEKTKYYEEAQYEIAHLYFVCAPDDHYIKDAYLHICKAGEASFAKSLRVKLAGIISRCPEGALNFTLDPMNPSDSFFLLNELTMLQETLAKQQEELNRTLSGSSFLAQNSSATVINFPVQNGQKRKREDEKEEKEHQNPSNKLQKLDDEDVQNKQDYRRTF